MCIRDSRYAVRILTMRYGKCCCWRANEWAQNVCARRTWAVITQECFRWLKVEIVRTCMNDLWPPHVIMNYHVFQRARGWIFVSDRRSMRMICPLVRKERCRWAPRVLEIRSYMISTFRLLPGEDMAVQNPREFFSGVSSGVLDNNLKEKIIHNGW